jgi:hypothetical protein
LKVKAVGVGTLILLPLVLFIAPAGAAEQTLTIVDARMGYSMSELVEVDQSIKRELGSDKAGPNPALQVCMLKLMQAEKLSFRGVVDLSTSIVVAAQMQTEKDENTALQGTAIEARWLRDDLVREKIEVEKTISECQSPDVGTIGRSLAAALNTSANATDVIVSKTNGVRIDTGGHQP